VGTVPIETETEHRPLNDPTPVSRVAVARFFVAAAAVCVLVPTLLGFAGRHGWQIDLLTHFRFQYCWLLLASSIALAVLGSRRVVWLSLAGLAINLCLVVPLYLSPADHAEADPAGPELVIMHRNVNTGGGDPAGVARAIRDSGADLVFLQEVTQRWLDQLLGNLGPYELIAAEARSDNFGIAVYKRRDATGEAPTIEIDSARVFDITAGIADVPVIELLVTVEGRPLSILSIHPLPPVNLRYARDRDATLAAAADWANQQPHAHLIVGDFNATPWSTAFRDLVDQTKLVNSQLGFGRQPTWPTTFASACMIPIDHLLHSTDLVTIDRRLGEAHGSDHLPLIVTLSWSKP